MITILDGAASFTRGADRFMAAEGVTLTDGDIVLTSENALVQLEFADGTRLELGPQTQLMLLSRDGGPPPRRAAYLLGGWLKLTVGPRPAGSFDLLRTPHFELAAVGNVTVTRIDATEGSVFAESGPVPLRERATEGSAAQHLVKAGQFYVRRSPQAGAVLPRPSPRFLQQLPPAFRDTLPSRIERFLGRSVDPAPDREPAP